MRNAFVLFTLSLIPFFTFTSYASAEYEFNIESFETLKDQFGQLAVMNPETKWIIFVSEKPASKMLTKAIDDLKINLDKKPVIYVSNISKMPAMISKMFALPKMKKLGYKMVLDRTGDVTKDWPKKSGTITVMSLSNQIIKDVKYLDNEEATKAFLRTL